jgi:hypothetical protein
MIQHHNVCKPTNTLKFNDDQTVWLNPDNHISFISGAYTAVDLRDWLNGTGKIIKGSTDEEKAIFWKFAKFNSEFMLGHSILYAFKHFDKLANTKYTYNWSKPTEPKYKITKTNHTDIISGIIGNIVLSNVDQFASSMHSDIRNKRKAWDFDATDRQRKRLMSELDGVVHTLYDFGLGYFSSVNSPEELRNLSFAANLAELKCYYLALIEADVDVPDFEKICQLIKV